jgi:hypothetical protein
MARAKPKVEQQETKKKMGFISEPLDDVREAQVAPEGEYDLRIRKATQKESKKGTDMVEVMLVFEDKDVDAPPIFHYVLSWDSSTPDEQVASRKREIKRFQAVFDLEDGWEVDDLVGQTGTCMVTQDEGDDNVVRNRLKLPRIKE